MKLDVRELFMGKVIKTTEKKQGNVIALEVKDQVKLKTLHRCKECNKLLGVDNFVIPSFDVKCPRCGTLNEILKDLERQILITDKNGIILYINKQVEKATGYTAKEILGKRPSLWGNQMSREFYKRMWKKISQGKKAIAVELINKKKTGELYPVAVRISPLLDEKGEIEYFMGIETVIRDGEEILRLKNSQK